MRYSTPDESPTLANLFSMQDCIALVIGGSGLLGGQISYAFAELGCNLILASRNVGRCKSFADTLCTIHPSITVDTLEVDITDGMSIRRMFDSVSQLTGGKLDVLVNSGWSGRKNTFESITDEDWDLDLEVCLSGVFRTIKLATPMLEKNQGNILSVASMYGHVAPDYRMYDHERFANPPSYGAAKAGVIQLTKYLASFLSPRGIRANCISPGPFPFESTQIENPDFIVRLSDKNPVGRIGVPHEIKGAAALLCSKAGSYMTGQNICVDGGWGIW